MRHLGIGSGGCSRRYPNQLEEQDGGHLWKLIEARLYTGHALDVMDKERVPLISHSPYSPTLGPGPGLSRPTFFPEMHVTDGKCLFMDYGLLPVNVERIGLEPWLSSDHDHNPPWVPSSLSSFPHLSRVFKEGALLLTGCVTPKSCLVDGGRNIIFP